MSQLPAHESRRLKAVATDEAHLSELIERRLAGEPLQYLEGTAAFGPLDLLVDERVLIPRPETEQLWELAVKLVVDPGVVVDMCTGSGALALALAGSYPNAAVHGTDIAPDALDVAAENSARVGRSVTWHHGDLFDALPPDLLGRVDLVVCNPPYVSASEFVALPVDVLHEPMGALVSGPTGLEVIAELAAGIGEWLAPDGVFVVEMGETQGGAAVDLFAEFAGEIHQDLTGRDRFVVGRR